MKTVYCTVGGSLNDVCQLSMCRTAYPVNWPRSTRQDECTSIEQIKAFIADTQCGWVNFAVRSPGIPNRAVKVSDTEKLEKAFKKFEKLLNTWR